MMSSLPYAIMTGKTVRTDAYKAVSAAVFGDVARTAAVALGGAVAAWADVAAAKSLTQTTVAARPTLAANGLAFDGVNDHLAAVARADLTGSVLIAFTPAATAFATRGAQVLVSTADANRADTWLEFGITNDGRIYVERNAAGVKHTIVGTDRLAPGAAAVAYAAWDGSGLYLQVGGREQNPLRALSIGTFGWFGAVQAASNVVVGGTLTSAGLVRPFQGLLHEVRIYDTDITI